eukprot:scaffold221029_cov35-Tisochrysis_lutea.AAC.3
MTRVDIIFIEGAHTMRYEVHLNVMGEPHVYEPALPQPPPLDLKTPLTAQIGERVHDGPADMAYPLLQEFALKGTNRTLEDVDYSKRSRTCTSQLRKRNDKRRPSVRRKESLS